MRFRLSRLGFSESLSGSFPGPSDLDLSIAGFGLSHQRIQQLPCNGGKLLHRLVKRRFVRFGRTVKPRELPCELQRCSLNFFIRRRRVEIE